MIPNRALYFLSIGTVAAAGSLLFPLLSFAKWLPRAGWAGIGAPPPALPASVAALLAIGAVIAGSHTAVMTLRVGCYPGHPKDRGSTFSCERGARLAAWLYCACVAAVAISLVLPPGSVLERAVPGGVEAGRVFGDARAVGFLVAQILAAVVVLRESRAGKLVGLLATLLGALGIGGQMGSLSCTASSLVRGAAGLPETGGEPNVGAMAASLLWVLIAVQACRSPLRNWAAHLVAGAHFIQACLHGSLLCAEMADARLGHMGRSGWWVEKCGEVMGSAAASAIAGWGTLLALSTTLFLFKVSAAIGREPRPQAQAQSGASPVRYPAAGVGLCAGAAWFLLHFTPVWMARNLPGAGIGSWAHFAVGGLALFALYFSLWRLLAVGFAKWHFPCGKLAFSLSASLLAGYFLLFGPDCPFGSGIR